MQGYNKPNATTYINYDDSESVGSLELNVWEMPSSGPRGRLYENPAIYGSIGICSPARDPDRHYVSGVERPLGDHPDHSSRFGYGRCPNGYCVGNWSSGFYNTPPGCQFDPQPKDMAPKRFYTDPYQGRNRVDTQATVDYNNFSDTFNGPFIY